MSKGLRKIQKDRIPQWKLDSLIEKKQEFPESLVPIPIEREHVDPRPMLFNSLGYDTLHPAERIKAFCSDVREMISRYEGNKERFDQLEREMQDLLHFIEMSGDKNANIGFKLYKRLAEVRRERRICKNEMDLLQPVYMNFKETDLLNILGRIQGSCKDIKKQIDGRAYTVRTDILEDFIHN